MEGIFSKKKRSTSRSNIKSFIVSMIAGLIGLVVIVWFVRITGVFGAVALVSFLAFVVGKYIMKLVGKAIPATQTA